MHVENRSRGERAALRALARDAEYLLSVAVHISREVDGFFVGGGGINAHRIGVVASDEFHFAAAPSHANARIDGTENFYPLASHVAYAPRRSANYSCLTPAGRAGSAAPRRTLPASEVLGSIGGAVTKFS